MKILKPGNLALRKFVCNQCHCVFVADSKEYSVDEYKNPYSWDVISYRVTCPYCDRDLKVGICNAPLYTEEQENENKDNY